MIKAGVPTWIIKTHFPAEQLRDGKNVVGYDRSCQGDKTCFPSDCVIL